jgi:hypothetical protein
MKQIIGSICYVWLDLRWDFFVWVDFLDVWVDERFFSKNVWVDVGVDFVIDFRNHL